MDFDQSDCSRSAKIIVSNASAVLAELMRLSNYIPEVFLFTRERQKDKWVYTNGSGKVLDDNEVKLRQSEQLKYLPILMDFEYVTDPEGYDKRIQDDVRLIELDEAFKETYIDIIERFYNLFESIYTYYTSLSTYLADVNEGRYLEFTLENVLQDESGKRLIIEAIYHYGVMLLLLDRLIPAIARERLVVCYIRYLNNTASVLSTKVVKLCRNTGYSYDKLTRRESIPEKYPERYFKRFKIELSLCESLINAMKDDDIYDMLQVYGNKAAHRSFALSTQASMIFVLLPFCGLILEGQKSKMREICDKHFSDNWVIPFYGGELVDLTQYWCHFPAAQKALANNIDMESVKYRAQYHQQEVQKVQKKIQSFIVDGQLQEKEALDNIKPLSQLLRDANSTLRWIMLHQNCADKEYRAEIAQIIDRSQLIDLLLNLSKFENLLQNLLTKVVSKKSKMWESDRQNVIKYMREISAFFAGDRDWGETHKDDELSEYFERIAAAVEAYEYGESTKSGRKIQKLLQALDDLTLQHMIIADNVQIQHYLSTTIKKLTHMIQIMGIKKSQVQNVKIIIDFSYAWVVIYDYLELLQKTVTQKAKSVLLLKTVFLKLSTIMDKPLKRIFEIDSEDRHSVQMFYSRQLFNFIKAVLYVIPVNIFKELDKISTILAVDLKEFEVKISKDYLKSAVQQDKRFELAQRTHQITMYTEGMLVLDNVLMGVIQIDPKEILVDGLRKELCKKMSHMLHKEFIFTKELGQGGTGIDHSKQGSMGSFGDYEEKFATLRTRFGGLKRAVEFIQDFLNVQGEKIWREEMTLIVNSAVDREAQKLVNKRYMTNLDEMSYVPQHDPVDADDLTFMGRFLRHILKSLDRGFYLETTQTWYGSQGQQVFGQRYINFISDNLGTVFLQGLDRLIAYNTQSELRQLYRMYGLLIGGGSVSKEMKKKFEKKEFVNLVTEMRQIEKVINGNYENLNEAHLKNYQRLATLMPSFSEELTSRLLTIGKLQLLRRMTTSQIQLQASVECSQYNACLRTFNNSILYNLKEIKNIAQQAAEDRLLAQDEDAPETNQTVMKQDQTMKLQQAQQETSKALKELTGSLSKALEHVGFINPVNKVYQLTRPLDMMSIFLATFSMGIMKSFVFDRKLCTLRRFDDPKKATIPTPFVLDGPHLLMGIITLFKQFHHNNFKDYIQYLGHFYKQHVAMAKGGPLPPEAGLTLAWLEELMRFDGSSREVVNQAVGGFTFDCYNIGQ